MGSELLTHPTHRRRVRQRASLRGTETARDLVPRGAQLAVPSAGLGTVGDHVVFADAAEQPLSREAAEPADQSGSV